MRPVARDLHPPRRTDCGRPKQHVDALVGLEPAEIADDRLRPGCDAIIGRKLFGVDPEGNQPRRPAQPFALKNLPRLTVAHVRPRGATQCPSFEPPERHGVALVDVLG